MKSNRSTRIIALVLTVIMTSFLITPSLAFGTYEGKDNKPASKKGSSDLQSKVLQSIRAQDDRTEFSPAELEEMRSALLELFDSVQQFAGLLSPEVRSKAGMQDLGEKMNGEQADQARSQIQKMSPQELTSLRRSLDPSVIHAKLAASTATLAAYKATRNNNHSSDRPGLPGIDSYCGAPVSTEAIIASDVIYFVAEGVRDIAQNVCNEVIAGINTRLACNVTDAIYLIAKALNVAIHFCDTDYAASVGQGAYDRLGHIHDDVEDVKANDNTNHTSITTTVTDAKTAIINNDNTNKDTIVNNDNANLVTILAAVEAAKTYIVTDAHANKDEMKNLLLRTQIEADLSSTDGSTFVALYETPVTVCLTSLTDRGLPLTVSLPGFPTITINQCGLLDLVRAIVRDTIANVGAGTNAQSFYATAEAYRNAGRYKLAYSAYRSAYKAASK